MRRSLGRAVRPLGLSKEPVMVRFRLLRWSLCIAAMLSCAAVLADENPGQDLLDKATEVKLSAENVADLNEVIKLCQDAMRAGLDENGTKFANELLASTLTQRAELICTELFERPLGPGRARRLVQMAFSDLQETLQINADQPTAQYLIGRLYAHLGQKEKALKALSEAVRLSADDPATRAQALVIRANVQPDAEKRQADFDEAVKLTPKDPDALRFRGMSHLAENHAEAAVADFKAALELDPEDADTHEACGLALSVLEKYDEAMECFNKAVELNPEAASALTHRARVRAIKGDSSAAMRDVEKALELQPGSVQALQLHAALLGSAGKFEQALRDLNLLRTAMPDNAELLLQIAALYQASKQSQKAVDTYDALLKSDASSVAAYRGRADSYLSLGKQSEAVADYEQALKHEPKNSGVLNNLAWVLATSPEDRLRDGKRSIELAKLACEVTEYKEAHILSTLAAGYAESGDFDTAISWSKKAVELGSDELKDQLRKELESYEAHKPWREATPPDPPFVPQESASENGATGSKPARDDTAGTKRGRQ
jgi:tetratricopeptide (TPR) repeat protein